MKGLLIVLISLSSLANLSCLELIEKTKSSEVLQFETDSLSYQTKDSLPERPPKGLSYNQAKININLLRAQLKKAYSNKTIDLDSVGQVFTRKMLEEIIPFWYGTEWDFNGYTSIPQKGVIACGYFVSTTILHSGCHLNRYKMAQKPAKGILEMLKGKGDTLSKHSTLVGIVDFCQNNLKQGLYVLGLSYHVGFLYKDSNATYFIHSNYINNQGVVYEKIENSKAFQNSNVWYMLNLSHNSFFLESWLNEKVFQY
jgi:hypothetical protein